MRNVLETRNVWNFMPNPRWIFAGLLAAGLLAQGQQDPAKPEPAVDNPIKVSVQVVVAPVTVTDRNGENVDGLGPEQFHLFDNGKEQNIHVDVSFPPISLVIAVQANDHVESVLPQIQKIGGMIAPIVIGDQGEASARAGGAVTEEVSGAGGFRGAGGASGVGGVGGVGVAKGPSGSGGDLCDVDVARRDTGLGEDETVC